MKRVELIANKSVQEDLVRLLESSLDIRYTLLPVVNGRGPEDWKLGTTVWPEENFILFSYLEDDKALVVEELIRTFKEQYPREGIKLFVMTVA